MSAEADGEKGYQSPIARRKEEKHRAGRLDKTRALAVLEGRANSSKQSLVLFEPREIDYDKVVAVLKETKDEAKALAAGKAEARSFEDVTPDEHIAYMRKVGLTSSRSSSRCSCTTRLMTALRQ